MTPPAPSSDESSFRRRFQKSILHKILARDDRYLVILLYHLLMRKINKNAAISGLDVKINQEIRFLINSPDIHNSDWSKVTESEWSAMKVELLYQKVQNTPDNVLISFSTSWKASIVQLFDILEISSRVSFGLLSRFADHSHEPILAGSDTQIVGVSIWLQLLSIVLMKWLAACLAAAFSMPSKLIELTNVRLPTIDLKTWWLGRPQDRRVSDMAVCVTCDMQ